MADLEKSATAEHHEHLDHVSLKDEHSSHDGKPLAPVDTLVPVDIHNSQAFKGDDSDGQIHWTLRKWFAAAFLAMLYTGMAFLKFRQTISSERSLQAPRFYSTSPAAHYRTLPRTLEVQVPSAGCQWQILLPLHRYARSLGIFRICSESDTSRSLEPCVFALGAR